MKRSLPCVLLLMMVGVVAAQNAPAAPPQAAKEAPRTISSVMDRTLSGVEKQFVGAADAMPEDKYSFVRRRPKSCSGEFKGAPWLRSRQKTRSNPFGEGTVTRLGLGTLIVGHCFDHYGQMVEYLRMNGIIPPASRR